MANGARSASRGSASAASRRSQSPPATPRAALTRETLAAIETGETIDALGGIAGLAAALGTDLKRGLSAARVVANRAEFGENRLPHKEPRSLWSHFAEAFEDETLRILIFSSLASITFALFVSPEESKQADLIQGLAILLAVAVVSSVNSFQNWSKDREFSSLAALKADRRVSVFRDGAEVEVST
jgi:magnesium-transporting ATPase (P-type)